jgi:hypothetical protein
MNSTTAGTAHATTTTPGRPGLLARLLAAFAAAPAARELDPVVLREIGPAEERRAQQELRDAWRRFMPVKVMGDF